MADDTDTTRPGEAVAVRSEQDERCHHQRVRLLSGLVWLPDGPRRLAYDRGRCRGCGAEVIREHVCRTSWNAKP